MLIRLGHGMVVSLHRAEGWFWELSGLLFEQGWKVPRAGHYTLSCLFDFLCA